MSSIYQTLYSVRETWRNINRKINLFRLKHGLYRKAELPEYDFNALNEKWPYRETCCVSDGFSNTPYDGKTNVSIIVPLYNSSAFIERLASQLMNQKTKYQYEIIFVDDGSTDDTADKLRKIMVGGGVYGLYSRRTKAQEEHETRGLK